MVISFIRVISRFTRISWQLRQPVETAECTNFPFALSAWHSRHFAESTFLSRGTGCSFANAGIPNRYKENCELEEAGEGLTNFELNAHTETK